MLEYLRPTEPDPMWSLWAALEADPRPDNVNMVLGVYRDDSGATPVMAAVAEAEQRLAARRDTKSYRELSGNAAFNDHLRRLVLGDPELTARAVAVQTVAGTGALRLLDDLVATLTPRSTVWISDPGYVNHGPLAKAAGLRVRRYPYLDAEGRFTPETMLAELDLAEPGDVVVLQACCHNPTGVDMPPRHWDRLAELCARRRLVPLVDLAYLGFGEGAEADAAGLRRLARGVDEMLVAVSCSKSFGLYRERVGGCLVIGPSSRPRPEIVTTLENIARTNYSMPPDHGASVVVEVLEDDRLTRLWTDELAGMRRRLTDNRARLATELGRRTTPAHLLELGNHAGMFSVLPHTPEQMRALREDHGVYGTDGGRINIAGMRTQDIARVAAGIAETYQVRLHQRM